MLDAAKKMPSDPNSVYSRTMDQINLQPEPQARLANRILAWLTFAGDTLTSRELVEALAIEDQSTEIDPLNKPSASMLARVCRGLVIVNESNDIIQLAHRTLQDYLVSSYGTDSRAIHNTICSACLTYLSYNVFQTGPCAAPDAFRHRRTQYVFQQYAAGHLGYHFQKSTGTEAMLERIYQFITCKPLVESYTQARNYSSRLRLNSSPHFFADEGTTELHVAATFEDSKLLELVLTRSPQLIDEVDKVGRTALAVAVERGCEEAVRSLLGAGAKMQSASGESLLNCAARNRHDDIVELLLSYRDPHRPESSEPPTTPQERQLLIAAMKADKDVVKHVLDLGTNPDARDVDGGTSLQWAAWYGYDEIVSILLDRGADVNAVDGTTGRTALHEAAEHGNLSTVEILLESGAEVDAKDIWGWTPLHRAATQGGRKVVYLLLDKGADYNLKASGKKTPLDLACDCGQLETIILLIGNHGGTLPKEFDAKMIDFWRVPMATRIKVQNILLGHVNLPELTEAEHAEKVAALHALTSSIEEEPWNSDPSDLDNFFSQGSVIGHYKGTSPSRKCVVM
jgi:ankyrin repeat protein